MFANKMQVLGVICCIGQDVVVVLLRWVMSDRTIESFIIATAPSWSIQVVKSDPADHRSGKGFLYVAAIS